MFGIPPGIMAFIIGLLFGFFLILSGLADPDKIVGTFRLKDFHAMRVIAMFVLVGMVGTWLLDLAGLAHFSVKPAAVLSILLGGGLLGVGMGICGYCPGTGLACAIAGRLDALFSVLGMFAGALVFILIYPDTAQVLDQYFNEEKVTLPEITGISRTIFTLVFAVAGFGALYLTRPKKN